MGKEQLEEVQSVLPFCANDKKHNRYLAITLSRLDDFTNACAAYEKVGLGLTPRRYMCASATFTTYKMSRMFCMIPALLNFSPAGIRGIRIDRPWELIRFDVMHGEVVGLDA